MSTFWEDQLEDVYAAIYDLKDAVDRLALLAEEVRRPRLNELLLTTHLTELLATTADDPAWDDVVFTATDACAGVRVHGLLDLGPEWVWPSAAAAVAEMVDRAGQMARLHRPFGEAVDSFNTEYDRIARHLAIRAGDFGEAQIGDAVPVDQRFRLHNPKPPRSAVLRAGWAGGPRNIPGVPTTDPVWAEIETLNHVWAKGARVLGRIWAFQRAHLATFPLSRIRAELHWEAARVAHVAQTVPHPEARRVGRTDPIVVERQDARDRWIYEQMTETTDTLKEIVGRLRREAPNHGWRVIGSIEGVRKAAQRYVDSNGLPPLPSRQ